MDIIENAAMVDMGHGIRMDRLQTRRTKPTEATPVMQAQDGGWRYILSTSAKDLVGDVVEQAGLTPVGPRIPAQLDHSGQMRDLVGWWEDIEREGEATMATLRLFAPGVSTSADLVRRLHEKTTMRMAASIGFVPSYASKDIELLTDKEGRVTGLRFIKSTLIEASIVVVPAQPQALAAEKDMDPGHLRRLMASEAGVLMRAAQRGPVSAADALAKARALIAKANALAN